jgi:hypothetical protein
MRRRAVPVLIAPSVLAGHIDRVILLGAKEEMVRSNAAAIIALMQDKEALRNFTETNEP